LRCRLFFFAVLTFPVLAGAEESRDGSAACRAEVIATGVVATVLDGRTLRLTDGREVRLAALEVAPLDSDPSAAALGVRAKTALEALAGGRSIAVQRSGKDHHDRYGRLVGQVFLNRETGERWAQAELVAGGHARVASHAGGAACAAALLQREQAARAAKLGLWAEPYYVIRKSENPEAIMAERGRFAIVEGIVLSVRESGGTIYVNFSRRWSEDFTVTIAKRRERMFSASGLEPRALSGRRVRVRGWVEERGGPWIEAVWPEQIEVVERN
jgi:endonuclease YncB( thermonuclease family)